MASTTPWAKYGEGNTGRSGGIRPDSRDLEDHNPQPHDPGQRPRGIGGRAQEEANLLGRTGKKDDNNGGYGSEIGKATRKEKSSK